MARVSYEKAVEALKNGATIMVTHPRPFVITDRTTYTLSTGESLTQTTWQRLVDDLAPVRDGLFPDAPSQTFKLARQ